jgi:uncharacterized DUF497 family protein
MRIEFAPAKRAPALAERSLDFERAAEVFLGRQLTRADDRHDYGAARFVTACWLDARVVMVVWTQRGDTHRIISMRKANARETQVLIPALGGS